MAGEIKKFWELQTIPSLIYTKLNEKTWDTRKLSKELGLPKKTIQYYLWYLKARGWVKVSKKRGQRWYYQSINTYLKEIIEYFEESNFFEIIDSLVFPGFMDFLLEMFRIIGDIKTDEQLKRLIERRKKSIDLKLEKKQEIKKLYS